LSIKNFGGRSPACERMKSRRQRGNLKKCDAPTVCQTLLVPARRESTAKLGLGVPATRASRGCQRGDERKGDTLDTGDVAPIALFCYFVGSRDELKSSFSFGPVSH